MSIEYVDFSVLPIREMFSLTSTDFTAAAFREKCTPWASLDGSGSDEDLLQFELGNDIFMQVPLFCKSGKMTASVARFEAVSAAITSVLWWDSWNERDSSQYIVERRLFDEKYAELVLQVSRELGAPIAQREDCDATKHKYAFWRGANGLFIVQQSSFDLQFGVDINLWIQPWAGPNPEPSGPFVDFLCKLQSVCR